ncbi:hypothetical protein HPB49_022054 [Dermacentor silvarum]|uniref:Uncharacterized protein n=1 Tax=Dermacentor silvarum TaxID=543639 RepID=A0ACB8DR82_DERSI|nr:hypothetical protein HPB49_022054 [Dermacentor silvarum]
MGVHRCCPLVQVLCLAAAFVYFAKSYLQWPQNSPFILVEEGPLNAAVADCITAITIVIVCLASLHRFFAAQYTSAYLLFVFTLVFTASATDLCRLHGRMKISNQALAEENDFKTSLLVLTLLTVFVTAGNMVVCGLRDTTVYNPKSFKFERAGEEESWSPLGLFACAPVHRSLKNIIGKSTTNIRRFVKPSLYSQCARTVATLYAKAKNGVLPGSKGRLLYALWCVTWREVLWIMASGIAYYLTLIARALVLDWGRNPPCRLALAFPQWCNSAPSAASSGGPFTKAISTIDALQSDEATAVRLLHQHLELVLAKQAELVEFDRAIRETLTDADLEADLTTAFEYEQQLRQIPGIRLADTKYYVAIKVLSDRFSRCDMLVDDHLAHLLAIEPIRSSIDLDKFRNLYNEITFRTSTLEDLGVSPDEYAAVLRRVIMKALPPDLGMLYRQRLKEASLNHDDTAAITEDKSHQVKHLMTCLRIQVKVKEEGAFDLASSPAIQRHDPRESRPLELNPSSSAALSTVVRSPFTRPCLLCNTSHHTVQECSTSLTSEEKRRKLQARRRCFRCAKGNYVVSECRNARNMECAHCAGQHLASL